MGLEAGFAKIVGNICEVGEPGESSEVVRPHAECDDEGVAEPGRPAFIAKRRVE